MDSNTVTIYHKGTTYSATYKVDGDMVLITSPSFDFPPIRAIQGLPQEILVRQKLREAVLWKDYPHKENPPGRTVAG